jgi:chromosomal replication initiation ATPase DnaA
VYPGRWPSSCAGRYTDAPLQVIGEDFLRKHSSIIHSLETIEAQYTQNLKVKRTSTSSSTKIDGEGAS